MQQVVVKAYRGKQSVAFAAFERDSREMALQGYTPTSQAWAPGSYGCGAFLVALLLCVIIIGFLVFIYMLLVKPPGTLSVTYTRTGTEQLDSPSESGSGKSIAENLGGALGRKVGGMLSRKPKTP